MHLKNKIVRSVFVVTVLSIIGKITGFYREAMIAAYFGVGGATDAYFIAYSLPSILFSVIGVSMGLIFIPMYAQQLKKTPKTSHFFASNIINTVLLVGLMFTILGMIFSKHIIMIIAPKLIVQDINVAIYLSRIMFPMFIFISISYIVTGILQSHESFAIPSLVSIPFNITVVLGIVLFSKRYGIQALGWATLIGAVTQLIVQLPAVSGKFKYRFKINFRESSTLTYWRLITPIILGAAIDKANIMIDNGLASYLGSGSISAINYATKLVDFADSIAIGAIIAVVYPKLAKLSAEKKYDKLAYSSYNAIIGITQIILPIVAITVVLNKDIVRLVFQRGAFVQRDTNLTAYGLSYYALGMWGTAIRAILNRVFYSLEDTSTPMKISFGTLISNIVLNSMLVKTMGIGGLGLATSISNTMGVLILLFLIQKKLKTFNIVRMVTEGYKIALALVLMVYGILLFKNNVFIYNFYIKLLLSASMGVAVYLSVSWILRLGLLAQLKSQKVYIDIANGKTDDYNDVPVSVIIPCYMCETTIERAVDSIWNQTWRPEEVILIEDCSPDYGATKTMLNNITKRYPSGWIRVIYLNTNGGSSNARKIGWRLATQKYIAFLDAEDAWHPQKIEIQLKVMLKNPHINISGHTYEQIKGTVNYTYIMFTEEYFRKIELKNIDGRKRLFFDQLPISSLIIKKREIDQCFQWRQYYWENYLHWLSMMLLGYQVIKINIPLYYIYNGNGRRGLRKRLLKMRKEERNVYRILWANGFIGFFSLMLFEAHSYIKYIKGLALGAL